MAASAASPYCLCTSAADRALLGPASSQFYRGILGGARWHACARRPESKQAWQCESASPRIRAPSLLTRATWVSAPQNLCNARSCCACIAPVPLSPSPSKPSKSASRSCASRPVPIAGPHAFCLHQRALFCCQLGLACPRPASPALALPRLSGRSPPLALRDLRGASVVCAQITHAPAARDRAPLPGLIQHRCAIDGPLSSSPAPLRSFRS
jgi:hypothetical protein